MIMHTQADLYLSISLKQLSIRPFTYLSGRPVQCTQVAGRSIDTKKNSIRYWLRLAMVMYTQATLLQMFQSPSHKNVLFLGVGGSTIINGNIFTRGFPNDFDEWEALGNSGWGFNDVLKYFKKFEKINIPELNSDTTYHNTKGPLNIEYSPYHSKLSDIFLKSSKELGYNNIDYNNPTTKIGFSIVQSTIKNGRRMTASKAYLKPIVDR